MPTKRTRRAHAKRREISADHWLLLNDGDRSACENVYSPITFWQECRELWPVYRDEVLEKWIRERPGTRPSCWWLFDAPRLNDADATKFKGWFFQHDLIEHRRRISGPGCVVWEKLNYCPSYHLGIPETWFGDPKDPPQFESQYTYLKRHGLLIRGERKAAKEPAFTPRIEDASWWARWDRGEFRVA